MEPKKHGISPELLIHPGETISDILENRSLTQKELAQRAGVSEAFLSDVIHGKKDISKSLAMGLEYAIGVPSSFWLNLQANYNSELLSLQEEETVGETERDSLTAIHDVVKYLKTKGSIPSDLSQVQTILYLRRFFCVSNLSDLGKLVPTGAFRMSEKATINPYVLGAWLCLCKAKGNVSQITSEFDPAQIDTLVDKIKEIMCCTGIDPQKPLISLLAQYGIDFSVVHNFRGAPVHGYIARNENNSYQLVLTIRGSYADIFWFSLFHELGHIVNGDLSRPGNYIDAEISLNSVREIAADNFAKNSLLEPDGFQHFLDRGIYSYSAIESHARVQKVPSYIVIGRLQKEDRIPWDRFSKYKLRYKWAET